MPTPARSEDRSALRGTHYYRSWDGDANTFVLDQKVWRLHRPASHTNPRRPDKTRPPDSFFTEAWKLTDFNGQAVYRHTGLPPSYEVFQTGMVLSWTQALGAYPDTADADNLLQNVRLKALSSATESEKQLNAALKQANGTAKMVGRMATGMANGLDNLMQGPKGLLKRFGRMADWRKLPPAYLEYLYGWRPLSEDVSNGFEKLAKLGEEGFQYSMILKSSGRRRYSREIETSTIMYQAPVDLAYIQGDCESFARCAYRYDLPQWFIDQTPTIAPFSTVYENTPYSFVLDWFTPIGSWIGAMEAAQFSPYFVEGWELRGCREVFERVRVVPSSSGWHSISWSANGKWEFYRFDRWPLFSMPQVPQPPALNPLPGLQQAAQGLSLLTQAFQRWR